MTNHDAVAELLEWALREHGGDHHEAGCPTCAAIAHLQPSVPPEPSLLIEQLDRIRDLIIAADQSPEDPCCPESGPRGYHCTQYRGHNGHHVATGMTGNTLETWS